CADAHRHVHSFPTRRSSDLGGVLQRREALAGYLFTAPWTLGLLLFIIGPIIASLVISLTDWAGINAPNWVGLANYEQMFGNDPLDRKSTRLNSSHDQISYAV